MTNFYVDDNQNLILGDHSLLIEKLQTWLNNSKGHPSFAVVEAKLKTLSKLRKVEDTVENFDKELLRQTLRIDKLNLSFDPENKYYQTIFARSEARWNNIINS